MRKPPDCKGLTVYRDRLAAIFLVPAERPFLRPTPIKIRRRRIRVRKLQANGINEVASQILPAGPTGIPAVFRMRKGACVAMPPE